MSLVEIYGLVDPRGPWLRYIGKARDSQERLKQHIREAGKGRLTLPIYAWIRGLLADNLCPTLVVLATCDLDDWQRRETNAIRIATERKHPLLNVATGGDEPFCPVEVRAQNGRNCARMIHDDPYRKHIWSLKQRIGLNIRQGYCTPEGKARLRECAAVAPHLFGEWANL